jgi:HopA1 effector protein family
VSRYREQVAAALGAAAILGPTRYAWLGRRSRALPAALEHDLEDGQRRAYLVSCLREELYRSFYCYGGPVPARWGESQPMRGDPRLLAALSRANRGRGSWEGGWTIERVDDGEVVATGSRLRVRVPAADCLARALEPGAAVSLRLPKELPWLSPGFWFAVGDAPAPAPEPGVRVYWNVTAAGAPTLVEALTRRLNREGVPFRLKVADHPFRYGRRDAAVLYVEAGVFRAIGATLAEQAARLEEHLRPGIPAFTLELAPGVGLAEDAGGESFGARRCALLADAIVRANEGPASGVDAVAARFAEAGVDVDAPYRVGHHVL